MNDDPPPKFPVLTGVCAGLWLLHGCIIAVLSTASYLGIATRQPPGDFLGCLPVSTLYMVAGVLTLLGHMRWKFGAEIFGAIYGFAEMFMGLITLWIIPLSFSIAIIIAGICMMTASVLSVFDIDVYERWILSREHWQREHADE